ncbi:MAG: hypothetical protein KAR36_10125 [Candidatus Latescibacteria bacterium]|nr:hypothetical protein [Candidatus Latescibacterota bacterium]
MFRGTYLKGTAILWSVMLCVASAWGQITITAEDVAPKIGTRTEYWMVTIMGSMEATGISVGEEGGPHAFNITAWNPAGEMISTSVMVSSILPPHAVPMAADFPDADYVLYMEMRFSPPMGGPEEESDYYLFMRREPAGDVMLGSSDPNIPAPSSQTQEETSIYPLTLGKEWEFTMSLSDLGMATLEGVAMEGSLTTRGSADAWGTAITLARNFEVLRTVQTLEGTMSFSVGSGGGEMPILSEGYEWIAKELGLVASVQEIRMGPMQGVPELSEEIVITEVMWLTGFSEIDVEAMMPVQAATWGQIKGTFRSRSFPR